MSNASVNKFHWYDGAFYDRILAPNQKALFRKIIELIEPGSDIIDVGCGTGFFSFSVADTCKSALGIDLSTRNIARAKKNLQKKPAGNLTFQNAYLHDVISQDKPHFDYAVMTYVIHEVNEEERVPLLKEMASVADKIIIGDYLIPRSGGFDGKMVKTVEFLAGSQHYRNFRTYEANGGIAYLAAKAGLSIKTEIKGRVNHVAVLTQV